MHEYMLQFFACDHLRPELAAVSAPFQTLAQLLVHELPQNPERTVALRKLLEAKDAAVRAKIAKASERPPPQSLPPTPPGTPRNSL